MKYICRMMFLGLLVFAVLSLESIAHEWMAPKEAAKLANPLVQDEADFFLFTQLNVNTIKDVMEQLNQPLEKTHWTMDKWGCTGTACIPMALDDALVKGKGPRTGDVVLFCASGGGFSIACAIFKW